MALGDWVFVLAVVIAVVVVLDDSPSLHRYFFMTRSKSFSLTTALWPSHLAFFCKSEQRPSRSKSPFWTLGQFCSFSLWGC